MKKILIPILIPILLLCASGLSRAQEVDNTFGGWAFVEVNHEFQKPRIYLLGYVECDNYQFQRLDCIYGRFGVGYKPLDWLSFGMNYVPQYEPGIMKHFLEADIMGTLKSGGFKASIRERYRRGFTTNTNELRSRLKLAYSIPNTKFAPYLAAEVFTWGTKWLKTRHFVACDYNVLDYMQIEVYYLYYTFDDKPAMHAIGFGLNFNF